VRGNLAVAHATTGYHLAVHPCLVVGQQKAAALFRCVIWSSHRVLQFKGIKMRSAAANTDKAVGYRPAA
jgi:hypothetical protein